jgi:hypothetical protein
VTRALAFVCAAVAFGTLSRGIAESGALAPAFAVRAIPSDGGIVPLAPLSGFQGRLLVPSSDAKPSASVAFASSFAPPDAAPPELAEALAAVADRAQTYVWLEATPSDDVHFDPGDVGFRLALRGLSTRDDVSYFALACERSDCKPREIGPFYSDGDALEMTNAHTPFHFHFEIRRGLEYFAVVFARRCREQACLGARS